jgi:hypothetical protein
LPDLTPYLAACAEASRSGDARAFWLAHMRLEGAMMQLSRETWEAGPKPIVVRRLPLIRGRGAKHRGVVRGI